MREHVLDAHPSADVRVYTIWLPILSTDARSEIDEELLADRRVRQFWDEERVSGRWFGEADLGGLGYSGIVWDAYFLFGPQASWQNRPSALVGSGAPVIARVDELEEELRPLLQ